MNKILDNVLNKVQIEKIISLIKGIKINPNLMNNQTIADIAYLAYWLYIIDEKELAMEVASLIDEISFKGDFVVWERVQDALILESIVYAEEGNIQKSKEAMSPINEVDTTGDESTIRKNQRILQRVLNGSLMYDDEIEDAQKENNIQDEIRLRFLQFKLLCYMKSMGGSEKYPIKHLEEEIERERQFLKANIQIAQ